jgi:hypothetical protein
MSVSRREARAPLRVLLSEGSSTSAREALTVLGLGGHHVEIADPDSHCLARFSRFCRAWHRCPPLGRDPRAYVAYLAGLARSRRMDVVLPTHEQGVALAAARPLFEGTHLALPGYETYVRALDKAKFSRLLTSLDVAQPELHLVESTAALGAQTRWPAVVKAAIGTASRGVWIVADRAALEAAIAALEANQGFDDPVLVQELVEGELGHVQAIFAHGDLVGVHGYRQLRAGAGGGEALKESHLPQDARAAVQRIGAALAWHGGLSFDYITDARDGAHRFIDCNPRLVEPMSAWLAGTDLVDLLLAVSMGEVPEPRYPAPDGVRTRLALQGLLGTALRDGTRRALAREAFAMTFARGVYRGSREELTPVRRDPWSALPLMATAVSLIVHPGAAASLVKGGWGRHLLTTSAMRTIAAMASENGTLA